MIQIGKLIIEVNYFFPMSTLGRLVYYNVDTIATDMLLIEPLF